MSEQTCARCKRTIDEEADEFTNWEPIDETGSQVICPGCITGEEEQSIGDDAMATAASQAPGWALKLAAEQLDPHEHGNVPEADLVHRAQQIAAE